MHAIYLQQHHYCLLLRRCALQLTCDLIVVLRLSQLTLHEAYRQEHKRKTRFTKISMLDKLILTMIFRYEYRTMESIAKEYEVSLDTIADNIHWVERTLLNADILQTSVTCVYKTN